MTKTINASLFQEMIQAASTRLNNQAEYVNSLNVFPVPDGDTGTNMGMDAASKKSLDLLQNARTGKKHGSLYWLLDETKTAMPIGDVEDGCLR